MHPLLIITAAVILHSAAFAVLFGALRKSRAPRLQGRGLVPVIGRDQALSEALHAALTAHRTPHPQPPAKRASGLPTGHDVACFAQAILSLLFVLAWGLALAALLSDDPRWP